MSLKVVIRSCSYHYPRLDAKIGWVRRALRLQGLTRAAPVIEDCALDVRSGEIVAIVGPSGAGKTTLLRIIAGLERGYEGTVTLNGHGMDKPDRKIYLMSQAHTLLPWLTVEGNLRFNVSDGEGGGLPDNLLKSFGFLDMRKRYPSTLSGGERARVALMCAMCATPEVILLDEPFRGIDQITSEECQDELLEWLDETIIRESVILVSHNIADAVFMANRVVVVRSGPLSVYREIPTSSARERRSRECVSLEAEVFCALREIDGLRGTAGSAASPSS